MVDRWYSWRNSRDGGVLRRARAFRREVISKGLNAVSTVAAWSMRGWIRLGGGWKDIRASPLRMLAMCWGVITCSCRLAVWTNLMRRAEEGTWFGLHTLLQAIMENGS